MRYQHTQTQPSACKQLRAEACRILLQRDASHAHRSHLTLAQGSESSRTHASAAHQWPLQAASFETMRPARECVRIEAAVASRVVRLTNVAEARSD